MVNIFSYVDYRTFLKDLCRRKKEENPTFSFRNFARVAGFSSCSFLKMVMDGKRNLSPDSARRFASALKLSRTERNFFLDLVLFTQATDHEEKDRCCRRLTSHRNFLKAQRLSKEHLDYFSHWYYSAIREMAHLKTFRDDPAWIAKKLTPQITPAEARTAVEDLIRLGILVRTEAGRLVPAERDVTVESGVRSMAMMNYHRSMCLRAADALMGNKPKDRNHITITAAISREKFEEAKRRLEIYRRELCELFSGCPEAETVYQINLQLFHLTEVPDATS